MGRVLELSISQTDCPHPVLTARMKGLSILVMNTVRLNENRQLNFSIFRAPNQKSTKEAINMLSKFPGLEIREVVGIKKQLFSAIYSFPTTSALHRLSEFGLRLYPIYANNGIEKWFYHLSDENVAPLLTSINDETTKLIKWRKLSVSEFYETYTQLFLDIWRVHQVEDLPPSNRQILERAVLAGYYDWPRKISLTTLSANLSLPKATLSYRLRKAEKELMIQRTKHD
ncbi:MAG: helix-turn-helix domain-containing protein [Thermoplasmatales archaeon]|nr:helix-turn-helix domain-containing protein [Candidatus Thermoplasmatota archaeon]MCL6002612.1 helix-turn-helix domain-containing protein [Candidatus Thermoplasmatota archaeon]MDA8054595.1 helix-turn-helix domain-containing protein [Thermoplasmatales archaeon]